MSPNVVKKYEAYKNRVGNERRRFHATTRARDCSFFAGLEVRLHGGHTYSVIVFLPAKPLWNHARGGLSRVQSISRPEMRSKQGLYVTMV